MSSNATLEVVTSETEPLANIDEMTMKCSIKCPRGANCTRLSGNVKWFVDNVQISQTQLRYNQTTQDLYSFLNETNWSVYKNKQLSCQILVQDNQNRPNFDIRSSQLFTGIKCEIQNWSWSDRSVNLKI